MQNSIFKSHDLLKFVIILSIFAFIGCGGGDEPQPAPTSSIVKGVVSLPETSTLSINNLYLATSEDEDIPINSIDGSFEKDQPKDTLDLLMLLDNDGNLILLSIDSSTTPQSNVTVDTKSTAIALTLLNPSLAFNNKNIANEIISKIQGLPEINTLANYIEQKLIADPVSIYDENDATLVQYINNAAEAAITQLGFDEQSLVLSKSQELNTSAATGEKFLTQASYQGKIIVDSETEGGDDSGVRLSLLDDSDINSIKLQANNFLCRYVTIFKKSDSLIENNDVGEIIKTIEPPPLPDSLTGIKQLIKGEGLHNETEFSLDFSTTDVYGITLVGPGDKNRKLSTSDYPIFWPSLSRTAIFLVVAPTITVITKGHTPLVVTYCEEILNFLDNIDNLPSADATELKGDLNAAASVIDALKVAGKLIMTKLMANNSEGLIRLERLLTGNAYSDALSNWEKDFIQLTKLLTYKSIFDSSWKLTGAITSMAKASQVGLWSAGLYSDEIVWFKDADGDGYSDGISQTSVTRPSDIYYASSELTATSGDCNDNDPNIHPGATEVCGDGIDNNCDGEIDEGCPTGGLQGILHGNVNWSGDIHIVGDVIVDSDATLTIAPGTTVWFAANQNANPLQTWDTNHCWILVKGRLIAEGTNNSPITFTSNTSNPSSGDWGCIYFENMSGDSSFKYCTIEYGEDQINTTGNNYDNSLTIQNCIIRNGSDTGILLGLTGNPDIQFNSIYNNGDGINLHRSMTVKKNVTIQNNSITNNNYGIVNGTNFSFTTSYNNVSNNNVNYLENPGAIDHNLDN
jgi:hypothetical protein